MTRREYVGCAALLVASLFRVPRRVEAWLTGTFWIPCPICGDPFSGVEWERAGFPTIKYEEDVGLMFGSAKGVCTRCADRGLADANQTCANRDALEEAGWWINPDVCATYERDSRSVYLGPRPTR